jgi:hypothetical protein
VDVGGEGGPLVFELTFVFELVFEVVRLPKRYILLGLIGVELGGLPFLDYAVGLLLAQKLLDID